MEIVSARLSKVSPKPRYRVQVVKEIVYAQGMTRPSWAAAGGERMNLTLDAYWPETPPGQLRPAIMLYHGGGFKGGRSDYPNMVHIAEYFSSRGWAVFSVNYRLVKHHGTLPANRQDDHFKALYPAGRDAKAAVRWLHTNANHYHVSRKHITAFGGSAGGMLALMLGMSDPADYRDEITLADDPTLATTNLYASAEVQTVVAMWSGSNLLEYLGGQERFDQNDTPTLLIHGNRDKVVPLRKSKRVFQKLRQVGVPVDLHVLWGRRHGAWKAKVKDGRTIYKVAFDFIVEQQALNI